MPNIASSELVNDSEHARRDEPPSGFPESHSTPLPKFQLFILLYIQGAEPITAFVILPFITQLILEYGMTNGDEKAVGYYAGSVSSLFFLAEMLCVYHWGRISDRIGRRPVLLIGLAGLTLSMICFAISKTFAALMLSRALAGVLNGNVGVIKSMMAEITDETNQAQAFSFIPLVFSGGVCVASFLGGGLVHPYERFASIFGHTQFWKNYPYALPCFVSASFCISAFLLSFLFLKESLHSRKADTKKYANGTVRSRNGSDASVSTETSALLPRQTKILTLREVLTPQVRTVIANYGMFAMLHIAFVFLEVIYMSTPIDSGGLGFTSQTIGLILGINSIVSGLFPIVVFAPLYRRYGTRTLFLAATASYFINYLAWPLMNLLAKRTGKVDAAVIVVLVVQQLNGSLSTLAYTCAHILITSSAPTRNTLGATTGIGQSVVSFTRAVAPTATSSLFAVSLQRNLLGGQLVYLVLTLLVIVALIVATKLPKEIKRPNGWIVD